MTAVDYLIKMKRTKKTITILFGFVFLTGTHNLWAEPEGAPPVLRDEVLALEELPGKELTEEELAEKRSVEDEAQQKEEDLRDAIIENIDVSDEVNELKQPVEPSEALDTTAPTPTPTPTESTPTPTPTPKSAAEEEQGIWFDQFRVIPKTLQSLPEYIPGLAGNDWIFFGRAEGEYAHFSSGRLSDDSEFNFRSLRAGLIKVFGKRATVKMEVDLTDGDSNWTDLYVRFNTELGLVTVGNQKIAQTLVNQTSRLARTFMEEALPAEAFGLGRRMGVGWDIHKKNFGGHLTAFGGDINEGTGDTGYGGRFYFNPTKTRFSLFHVGISTIQEKIDGGARFRAHPESRVTGARLIDTQDRRSVDKQRVSGIELAVAKDSYSLRGEYFKTKWDRNALSDTKFDGYYVQANWAITGENFQYRQGKFLRIRPKGRWGAWELAARYSRADLNDRDVLGGEQNNTSLGLNWYAPGNRFRLMSNLIFVDVDNMAGDKDFTIAQLRAQFHW